MKNLKKRLLPLCLLFFYLPGFSQEDSVLKAMRDEMNRTILKLKLHDLSAPYFTAYYVAESSDYYIAASFGDIKQADVSTGRNANVDVRIGGKNFDNSHFISSFHAYKPISGSLPISDDYDAVRKSLWLLSDEAYKSALEKYSQKDSYKKKKDIKEIYGDLNDEGPADYAEIEKEFEFFDFGFYKQQLKEISAVFKKYPNIQDSNVSMNYSVITRRFVNSQGTTYKVFSSEAEINASISMQNEDGYKIDENKKIFRRSLKSLNFEKIKKEIEEFAKEFNGVYNSRKLEYYVGPAIFEDQASAEFFNQLFVKNISFNPKPWAEEDNVLKYYYEIPKLVDRINMRVFAPFISVYDDPLQETFNGTELTGRYAIDSEGVKPRRLELVKKGKLEAVYASRTPDKKIKNSNGHGRMTSNSFASASAGNVFINSDKKAGYKELKDKLMEIGREMELDYVVIIRKINVYREGEEYLGNPSLAYKLDLKTLKEEPLNLVEFEGIGLRSLRDIVLTSDNHMVYNFRQDDPYVYTYGNYPTAIISPYAVLISEIELKKSDKKPEKKPYLANPYFAGKTAQ
ncbi:MAG: hypothetical protein HY746_07055 [Elusimicrobia bacterium]|nr:hypothetical protein [Elusimicrobiota bacterium]